jgi:hypothetical protein
VCNIIIHKDNKTLGFFEIKDDIQNVRWVYLGYGIFKDYLGGYLGIQGDT